MNSFVSEGGIDLDMARLAGRIGVGPLPRGTAAWTHLDDAAGLVGSLADRDPRRGADSLWDAIATRLIATIGLLTSLSPGGDGGRGVEINAAAIINDLLVRPAEAFVGRAGPAVAATLDGWIAVQPATDAHVDFLTLCIGAETSANRDTALRRWSARRTTDAALEDLQLWRIPSAAARSRPWLPLRYARQPVVLSRRLTPFLPPTFRPLAGLRVIELGGLWAGPLATHLLQDLGAQVVKVEAPNRPDGLRASHATLFRALNDGKECRALDLRVAQDHDQFLGLVEDSLLVENMSGRVLPNLRLDASSLVAARRSRVVSMRAFRRHPDWAGLGSVIELAGGLALVDDEGSPSFAPFPVTDVMAGAHGALVAVRALLDPPSHVAFGQVEDVAETIGDGAISAMPAVGAA